MYHISFMVNIFVFNLIDLCLPKGHSSVVNYIKIFPNRKPSQYIVFKVSYTSQNQLPSYSKSQRWLKHRGPCLFPVKDN
jgi:hypothetical protein